MIIIWYIWQFHEDFGLCWELDSMKYFVFYLLAFWRALWGLNFEEVGSFYNSSLVSSPPISTNWLRLLRARSKRQNYKSECGRNSFNKHLRLGFTLYNTKCAFDRNHASRRHPAFLTPVPMEKCDIGYYSVANWQCYSYWIGLDEVLLKCWRVSNYKTSHSTDITPVLSANVAPS